MDHFLQPKLMLLTEFKRRNEEYLIVVPWSDKLYLFCSIDLSKAIYTAHQGCRKSGRGPVSQEILSLWNSVVHAYSMFYRFLVTLTSEHGAGRVWHVADILSWLQIPTRVFKEWKGLYPEKSKELHSESSYWDKHNKEYQVSYKIYASDDCMI